MQKIEWSRKRGKVKNGDCLMGTEFQFGNIFLKGLAVLERDGRSEYTQREGT